MNYTTREIAEITGSRLDGDGTLEIKNIAFDSRNIYSATKTAFIAINTNKDSGEKYIGSATDKGIRVIIAEHKIEDIPGITWIITQDSLQFIQILAKQHLAQHSLKTIGITGSNGKTIVKEWLYQTLFADYHTVKSPKSFNSQLGLPVSVLKINSQHEVGIFEVGISRPGEMDIMRNIFAPQIGVLTHIGTAHEANFDTQEQLINEKIKLFDKAETIIFNGDNPLVNKIITDTFLSKRLISYGLSDSNDLYAIFSDQSGLLKIKYFDEEFELKVQQSDEATITNALCVIAVLKEFNYSTKKILIKINALKAVEMRLESVNGLRNNLIVNDYYNLDLDSLKIAFQFSTEYNKPSKSLVLTDFLEGKDAAKLYQTVAELTNQQNFNKIFLVGEEIVKYRHLFSGTVHTFESTSQLIESHSLSHLENELILLKGARRFEIERVKEFLELQKHDTILEVNLNAILHNINFHKSLLRSDTKMMAMVKAFSYGLGGYEIAEFLQHHHIDYLGVAYADEGVDLRKNGITSPIMVMNPEQHSYDIIIDFSLEPEIYSFRVLELFTQQLQNKDADKNYPVHIKLETGMNRLGFTEKDLLLLLEKLHNLDVKVASVFSHLSTADDVQEEAYALAQLAKFAAMSAQLSEGLGYVPIRHILNSSGITSYTDHQFDMVRIGIGMVGVSPDPVINRQLRNAVRFKTVISQISEKEKGVSIGYSRKHITEKPTRIATIPVGYADGVPRRIGNGKGFVGIGQQLYPIVGNICMDMMMIDIADSAAEEGDEVIIFNSNPTLEEFSAYCETIPYEVLTSISRRVKRIYIKD